ncbi:MAG: Holliday junction branch migration protein RuvA [Alphaproteobacteria bacterium]|nr:Holliday junction branch migration protein RuvA [Alphaproteobacteria bacterium]
MIAALSGAVLYCGADQAVIDVGGVGYLVFASRRTLERMPAKGEAVRVLVETHVREDHIHLYGFIEESERAWFRLLTTVQGVGARVALAILSVLSADEIERAIAAQDKAIITRADGVGPKLAARITAELKDKVGEISFGAPTRGADQPGGNASSDAVSALVNLGYGRSEAFGAIAQAAATLGRTASIEALVKAGLRELGA